MTQLYCGDCRNYLMGSDGQCHDCSCGWNQPVETYEKENTELETEAARLQKENAELKEELDRERMRLTACGVAALENTKDCVDKRISKDNPYYSASYSSVCRAVDEEIRLREENAAQANRIAELEAVYEQQLDVAREFCRQYQIESTQLKAESDLDNETNLQLNLEIMTLKAENKKLGDYYMKINDMYWNDEIFEVNHGEGFYTDKFVEVVADL